MNWSQFAVLNCNLFLVAGYISDKIGPLIPAVGWLLVFFYIVYKDARTQFQS